MCHLKIPKDYFIRQYQETAFGYGGTFRPNTDHYVFRLPHAEYDGYTLTVTDNFGRYGDVQKLGDWYSVYVSSDDMPIVIKRTENREDGKRYKQYKFTPDELNSMYGSAYKHAVAFITIYRNNGKLNASEIIERNYYVGTVDDSWFICDELKNRRRIGTKGVELLCYITASDRQAVNGIFKKHNARLQELDGERLKVYRALETVTKVVEWELPYSPNIPEIAEVNDVAVKARQSLQARLDKINAEIAELDTELRNELTNRYGKAA